MEDEKASGCGFLVGRSMGASNAHVFCEKFQFEIYKARFVGKWVTARATAWFPDGKPFRIRICAIDTINNVALFKIP